MTPDGGVSGLPRADAYRAMTADPSLMVRESSPNDAGLVCTERHLQCVWYDARWRPDGLCTTDGETVTINIPGRWNTEAGPDFTDAVLTFRPRYRRVRGDVEIHLRASDWLAHGHAEDPRYKKVVAHVTYLPPDLPAGALPPGCAQIAMRDALRRNPAFSFESVDVSAYPYAARPTGGVLPCARAMAKWPPDRRGALLDAAGEERLRRKAVRLRPLISERGREQVLYEETMAALGFKHNKATFRRLATAVPGDVLAREGREDPARAYALLLGVAGLLPAPDTGGDEETRLFVRALWDRWWKQRDEWDHYVLPPEAWRLDGIRPANHPRRRLAAAVSLFSNQEPFVERLSGLPRDDPREWSRRVAELFADRSSLQYWRRRLSLGGKIADEDVALVGSARTAALLTNVIVPFLAAQGEPLAALLDALPPEQDNRSAREAATALFGRDHSPALYNNGLRRQGLLQIFDDFCLRSEGDCADCPLVPALKRFGERNQ